MNRVILIGNLTRDPESRVTQSGLAVCNLNIAVNRRVRQGQEGNAPTADFFRVTTFGKTAENCGRLMTIKDVELKDADGVKVFAPTDGSVTLQANCANREITGYNSSVIVVRTSSYADFANAVMPTGKVNITGIFTRYRNTWQILLRTVNDIQPAN